VGSIFNMHCLKNNVYKILTKKPLGRDQLERQQLLRGGANIKSSLWKTDYDGVNRFRRNFMAKLEVP
jgi:hypothetical protein